MKKLLFLAAIALNSLSAFAIKPSPYYVVADDFIAPHLVDDHENALRDFKLQVDKNGYKGSWLFYAFDDGRHVAFSSKQSHDYERQDGKNWEQVADKFPNGFLAENSKVYSKTIVNQDFYLMRYLSDLSHERTSSANGANDKSSRSPYMVWMELELHRLPVKKHLAEWVKQLKKEKSDIHFSVYSKQYGSRLPSVFVVFHVESIVEFYRKMEANGTHDPLRLLPNTVYEGIERYNVSVAKYIPEISY